MMIYKVLILKCFRKTVLFQKKRPRILWKEYNKFTVENKRECWGLYVYFLVAVHPLQANRSPLIFTLQSDLTCWPKRAYGPQTAANGTFQNITN